MRANQVQDFKFGLAGEEVIHIASDPKPLLAQSTLLSPVCRLTDEILANVFLHTALSWYNACVSCCSSDPSTQRYVPSWYGPYSGYGLTVPDSWVKFRRVCRHWNYIVLNWPSPWTYLVPVSLCFMDMALLRSKQVPLKICILSKFYHTKKNWLPTLLEKIGNHVERIQELLIDSENASKVLLQLFGTKTPSPLAASLASLHAPHLQCLRILRNNCICHHHNLAVLEPFNLDAPILHVFQLSECFTSSFPSSGLPNLSILNLSLAHVPSSCQRGLVEFLVDLRHMQNLRQLILNDALSSARELMSSPAFRSPQKITLPHLSRLLIVAPISTVFTLLWNINLPMKAEVRTKVTCEFYDMRDHALITSLVNHLVQRVDTIQDHVQANTATRSLAVVTKKSHCCLALRFAGSGSHSKIPLAKIFTCKNYDSLTHLDHEWGYNVPLEITITLSEMVQKCGFRILTDFCLALPLSTFHHVCIESPPFSSIFWRNLLGRLSSVRSLELRKGCMPDLIPVLGLSQRPEQGGIGNVLASPAENEGEPGGSSTPASIVAPVLQDIRLVSIDFHDADYFENLYWRGSACGYVWDGDRVPDGPLPVHNVTDVQPLCDALAHRKLRLSLAVNDNESPKVLIDNSNIV